MHKCVRCGSVFEDNDSSILRGCAKCGSIFFVFVKEPKDEMAIENVKEELRRVDTTLEKELEKEIKKRKARKKPRKKKAEPKPAPKAMRPAKKDVVIVGGKKFAVDDIFGIETVRIPRDGVYEINIDALMKKRPLIILERGKVYLIHLPSVFGD